MARVLILGGGFAAVSAAQELEHLLGDEHEIVLVSKSDDFTFYPAITGCILGNLKFSDIRFDLATALSDHGIRFINGDVEAINTSARKVSVGGEGITYTIDYDYVLFAVGRRLETSSIPGLSEFSHEMFTIAGAERFKKAIDEFKSGTVVVGLCPGATLPVPVCETALGLASRFASEIENGNVRVVAIFPETVAKAFAGANLFRDVEDEFRKKGVELMIDAAVDLIDRDRVRLSDGSVIEHDLLMFIPPFGGQLSLRSSGHVTDISGFANVNDMMQVEGMDHVYAAGDVIAMPGPKFGYMAIRQGKVAAKNIAMEIAGETPSAVYQHRIEWAIGELYAGPVFFHYGFWDETLEDFDDEAMFGMARKIRELYGPIKGLETARVFSAV